jgi:hypothetical protein
MKIEVYNLNKILNVADKEPGCNILSIRDFYSDGPTVEKYACLDRRVARNGINCKVIYFDDIDPYRFYHGMEHVSIQEKFKDVEVSQWINLLKLEWFRKVDGDNDRYEMDKKTIRYFLKALRYETNIRGVL